MVGWRQNMDAKTIGKNVLIFRKEKKVTQGKLAELASVSRNYISMIERGEAENISEEIVRKLAWGLGVSSEQLQGKPNERTGTTIPPALREFAINEGLQFETVDTLMQMPLRGKEPSTVQEWRELFEAIKPFILG
jgi:transcriptional regulator with XRE-family HTH domain